MRFDCTYAIGEVIPDEVIDLKMTSRLVEMGKIISVDIPASGSNAGTPSAPAQEGASESEGEPAPESSGEPSTEPEAEPKAGGVFVCPVCGKAFGSKNALSAHSRSHKK